MWALIKTSGLKRPDFTPSVPVQADPVNHLCLTGNRPFSCPWPLANLIIKHPSYLSNTIYPQFSFRERF